jgi:hypothetical protein
MRSLVLRTLAFAALCSASVSCGDDPAEPLDDLGPVPDVHFTTDTTGYTAVRIPGTLERYRFAVITRYQNRGATPVYLGRCFPQTPRPLFSVDIVEPATEESGFGQVWACVGHDDQFEILPGAARTDTFVVEGPNAFDGRTNEPFGVTKGIFRMYFDVRTARGDGAPEAPLAQRLSNAFRVSHE